MTMTERLAMEEPDPSASISHAPTAEEIRRLERLRRETATTRKRVTR